MICCFHCWMEAAICCFHCWMKTIVMLLQLMNGSQWFVAFIVEWKPLFVVSTIEWKPLLCFYCWWMITNDLLTLRIIFIISLLKFLPSFLTLFFQILKLYFSFFQLCLNLPHHDTWLSKQSATSRGHHD